MGLFKDRILRFIEHEGISIREFERKCGFSNGYFNKIKDFSAAKVEEIAQVFPNLNYVWVLTGETCMLNSDMAQPVETRPRVPLTAAAGSLSGDSIGVTLEQCEQMPLIHQIPSYDFTMFITGDSMSPKFESGDEIACRRIDQSRFIQWGKVHVLDTTQGFVIKRVYDDGDKIRCVSYNPEYADFSIPKEDILSMSLVVGVISIMEM